jgi:hypothetical protein
MTAMVAQEPVTVMFNRILDVMTAMIPESSKLPLIFKL